jgi:hypothetical protein
MAKSRWEIENQGFNAAKSQHQLEHICHHHGNSILLWLLNALALTIERLYRLRYFASWILSSAQRHRTLPLVMAEPGTIGFARHQLTFPTGLARVALCCSFKTSLHTISLGISTPENKTCYPVRALPPKIAAPQLLLNVKRAQVPK